MSCRTSASILLYFEKTYGRARMEEVYAGLKDVPPLDYVRDLNNWVSFDLVVRLLDAFADASGDPDFALKAGRFTFSPEAIGFLYYAFRALATPPAAYKRIFSIMPDANRVGAFTVIRLTRRELVVRYHSERHEESPKLCQMRQGQIAEVPTLWGLPRARMVHTQCQRLGAESCVYELSWVPYFSPLPIVLVGALVGAATSLLLLLQTYTIWECCLIGVVVGGSVGFALAYRRRSKQALKQLGDQDESLAMSFRDLDRRFIEIRHLNQTLERKVDERTHELSHASTQLRHALDRQAELLDSEMHARSEAERANRAKDHFLATLSHELRTPLSTMLMQATMLARLAQGNSRMEQGCAVIRRAVEAQTRLVDDLLDVSRIASGKLALNVGSVDIATAVEAAVTMARAPAEAKPLTLEASIDPSVGTVRGDPVRLQQVVSNLLTNAIKFTPRGGTISVRATRNDGRALIEVSDNGMGIRPEIVPQLFNRFVQADSSVTRTFGGLGLGLALVRHLVDAHGGEVSVESAGEGKGATFRVTLPLTTGESAKTTAISHATHNVSGLRVLLVDDDEDSRESFAQVLRQLGAEVKVASSAATGLASLQDFKPQVLLSDIAMPGEDGFSFMRHVRELPPDQGGTVPAAALTALTGGEDRNRALQAGFQLHLTKPVDATRLAEAVGTLASWKGHGAASAP